MSGHLFKRGENHWAVIMEIEPMSSGRRKQKWFNFHGNKKEALAYMAQLEVEISRGDYADPGDMTLSQYLRRWMGEYVKTNLKLSTHENYRQMIEDYVIPELGSVKLAKLRPDQLQQFYAKLQQNGRKDGKGGLSRTTVGCIHRILHSAFRLAVKWRVLGRNLADQVEPPKKERKAFTPFTAEQAQEYLIASAPYRLHVFCWLALETGMREGELLGLRWEDVDFAEGLLRVQKTLNWKTRPPVLQNVKTDGSYRIVPVSSTALALLRGFKDLTARERRFFDGEYSSNWSNLVLVSKYGTPIEPTNITRMHQAIIDKAGLPRIRIHDLRHTSATLALNGGSSLKVVSERLGHSSVQITGDIYTHVFLPQQKETTATIHDQLVRESEELISHPEGLQKGCRTQPDGSEGSWAGSEKGLSSRR